MKHPVHELRWVRACALGLSSTGLAIGGHALGGGHVEPVLLFLLVAASVLAAYAWSSAERSLLPIIAWVLAVQVVVHAIFAAGHAHQQSAAMLGAHAASAVLLGAFLRFGEARVFAAARRRYLRWVIAVRTALVGLSPLPGRSNSWAVATALVLTGVAHRAHAERGPPVVAC